MRLARTVDIMKCGGDREVIELMPPRRPIDAGSQSARTVELSAAEMARSPTAGAAALIWLDSAQERC